VVLLFAAAAHAQRAQPARPYRGLFGQRERAPRGQQSIDFTMSLSDAYDNNRMGESGDGVSNLPLSPAGQHSSLDSALRYTRGRRERLLTVSGGSALRYEPQLNNLLTANYQGTVAFSSPMWRGARVDLSQGAAYTPYYQFQLFPALSIDAADAPQRSSADYAIWRQPAYTYTSSIGFAQNFGTRSALQFAYDRRSVAFTSQTSDLLTEGASVSLTHRVTRYLGFHVGLGSRVAQYGGSADANPIRTYDVNIGLDSGRSISLSRSRRTTLSFSTGSSIVPEGDKHAYRLTGEASLRREIGRTWTANLQYNRALRFIEALPHPFFSDSISAGMRGNLSRRYDLGVSGGYSNGQAAVAAANGAYGTYTGSAQVSMSLTRHYALYSEYVYYHYRFAQQPIAGAFPGQLDRQTARVGLQVWFPLLD
jgi:hypothetical protein